jgi:hypothetical protein
MESPNAQQAHGLSANPRLANFYHICNIIPDTPEHGCMVWDFESELQMTTTASAGDARQPSATPSGTFDNSRHEHRPHRHHHDRRRLRRSSRCVHSSNGCLRPARSVARLTSDSESDVCTDATTRDGDCVREHHAYEDGGHGRGGRRMRRRPAVARRGKRCATGTRTDRHQHAAYLPRAPNCRGNVHTPSVADYTTDDESEADYSSRCYGDRISDSALRNKHNTSPMATPPDDASSLKEHREEYRRECPEDEAFDCDLQGLNTSSAPGNARQDADALSHHQVLPHTLDRRYDLDVAPSMLNMNLKFNGAYMVAANIYNILISKFGYKHMISVQMLFWTAVQQYYQSPLMDKHANYKISLSSLLTIAQTLPLCTERELSIYTDVAELHHQHARLYEEQLLAASAEPHGQNSARSGSSALRKSHAPTGGMPNATAFVSAGAGAGAGGAGGREAIYGTTTTTTAASTFSTHHLRPRNSPSARLTRPFYRMQHYYVPKDATVIKRALQRDHLVLANLTLFSSFLSTRQGVVQPPNQSDTPAGMVVITLVGYQDGVWIARFPFGVHWGDQGVGYISEEYFDRYNRDRWIIHIDECGEPPEYTQQREHAQASGNTAETGLLAVHMHKTQQTPVGTTNRICDNHRHMQSSQHTTGLPPAGLTYNSGSSEYTCRRRRVCA